MHGGRFLRFGVMVMLAIVLLAAVLLPALAATTVTWSGDTAADADGMMARPTNCLALGGVRPYKVQPFWVDADGMYTMRVNAASPGHDTIITLYQGSFDAANPLTNCVEEDDDDAGFLLSRIDRALSANTQYFLVNYGFGGDTGTYTNEISGPGNVTLGIWSAAPDPTPVLPDPLPQPPDDRLNWGSGDLHAVLYSRPDDFGDPALHVYCVNADGEGYLGLVVTQADFADVPAGPQANTLVASSALCAVDVYVLTTGEVSIGVTDPTSGKMYFTVMQDLAGNGKYFASVEP